MTPERWAEIAALFGQIADLPPDERTRRLAQLGHEDPDAVAELESLLEAHDQPGDFLSGPALGPPSTPDLTGRLLGPYRVGRVLGSGGMGAVYLAERHDGAFSRQVAVKVLASTLPHGSRLFQRERELLAKLDHPNIARLLDGGWSPEGHPYLVMEYIDGERIDRYCASHGLDIDDRLDLLLQVCAAIAHAHQHLIVHRDIKPENVLVTADGAAKVVDFGIARLLDAVGAATTLTHPATPAYASPEQLRGEPSTTASDVYSIGVLGYVLLAGSGPYPLRTARLDEVVRAVLTAEPVRASLLPGVVRGQARRLRGDLDTILLRAVAKDPRRRYATVQQLAGDLEHHRQGLPVSARPDTLAYRAGKRLRRNPVAATFACLTIASVAAGLATSLWQARLAQRRFDDVRQLAHAVVFDVNDALATVPGTTAARSLLVETALAYLDRLARDVGSDPSLREEIAAAYIRVGQVQGGWAQPSLGDSQGAVRSFQKAITAAGPAPSTVRLARLVIEAHINVAMLAADPGGAAPAFRAAIDAGEALPSGSDDGQTLRLMADAYHGLGLISHLTDQVAEEEEASRREITLRERIAAVSGSDWRDTLGLADAWAQHALAREQMTDYAGSLADLRTAQALLETAHRGDSRNQLIIRGLAEKRSRAGSVLRAMGRLGDSAAELHAAIGLLEPLVAADANNMQYRTDLAYAWFRLGETRRAENRLADALALHRRALEVRRRRAAQDQRLIFIRWDLARSLNAVADLVLATAPERAGEAEALFAEARDAAEQTLAVAPSFNEMRKQLAQACEGLARTTLTRDPGGATAARRLLERSLQTWEHVLSDGPGDLRERDRPARIRALLAGLPAPQHRIDPPAPATLARPASAPAPRS